ncbi:Uncharacterised protein [Faecalicoccus pleomorphus]|uniref:Uncharacterized protein n=1 Tax=Faecalicoccus pleomorphus TaxID=1323 RepID=A0A380LJ57_9FIRM|nr:Uncharacterised protein [Faecalicoccus pleomorphus]
MLRERRFLKRTKSYFEFNIYQSKELNASYLIKGFLLRELFDYKSIIYFC